MNSAVCFGTNFLCAFKEILHPFALNERYHFVLSVALVTPKDTVQGLGKGNGKHPILFLSLSEIDKNFGS